MKASVPGFRVAGLSCGIKPSGQPDLALIVSERPAAAAGVFTTNRFPGAPVLVSRRRVRRGRARAIVANSGNANVANGAAGERDALRMTELTARALGIPDAEVLVSSTGVIGRPLPMREISAGIARASTELSPTGWERASRAILTTDTKPKLATRGAGPGLLLGIAKGAGMLMPNMATLLAYLVTDLSAEPEYLRAALRDAVRGTFNCLTIDGQMSTSDMVLLLANGESERRPLTPGSARTRAFERALQEVCQELCEKLAEDGEGVTRLADVIVRGARSALQAERVARAIANSTLVKTALFGGDPNWGRVVQAAGAAGAPLDAARLAVKIGGVLLLHEGHPVGGKRALAAAQRALRQKRVAIEVSLGGGPIEARVLTTDLSYEYVRINAEYTT